METPRVQTRPDGTRGERWAAIGRTLLALPPFTTQPGAGDLDDESRAAAASVLVAHVCYEHDRDLEGLYCWNVGNVKYFGGSDAPKYYVLTDRPGDTDRYRAWPDLASGLLPFLREVSRRPSVWAAALRADPGDYGEQLLVTDYVGAQYPPYATVYYDRPSQVRDLRKSMEQLFLEVTAKRRLDPLGKW